MTVALNGNGTAPAATTKVKSPSTLAHVVFRTANYRTMVDFYRNFLGASITYENGVLAFLRYDAEHHRVAIIAIPDTTPKSPHAAGLEHVAFAYDSLDDLALAYRQRKTLGITPKWCTNHGPTTSMYYSDPDGNKVEVQVDNFDTVEAANEFMASKYFAENPIGTDFDPEELVRRVEAGESHAAIKKRTEIGPRGLGGALEF